MKRIEKLSFPIQYESTNTYQNFRFEANPRTGFDDWVAIDLLNHCDSEKMLYKSIF